MKTEKNHDMDYQMDFPNLKKLSVRDLDSQIVPK